MTGNRTRYGVATPRRAIRPRQANFAGAQVARKQQERARKFIVAYAPIGTALFASLSRPGAVHGKHGVLASLRDPHPVNLMRSPRPLGHTLASAIVTRRERARLAMAFGANFIRLIRLCSVAPSGHPARVSQAFVFFVHNRVHSFPGSAFQV